MKKKVKENKLGTKLSIYHLLYVLHLEHSQHTAKSNVKTFSVADIGTSDPSVTISLTLEVHNTNFYYFMFYTLINIILLYSIMT
jgi:hypothetical protein